MHDLCRRLQAALLPLSRPWQIGLLTVGALLSAGSLLLSCLTHQQFGWRMHSRICCDFRRKHAAQRRDLYFLVSRCVRMLCRCGAMAQPAAPMLNPFCQASSQTQRCAMCLMDACRFKMLLRFAAVSVVIAMASLLTLAMASRAALPSSATALAAPVAGGADGAVVTAKLLSIPSPGLWSAQNAAIAAVCLGVLPMAWLLVVHCAVARDSKGLELAATITVSLLMLWPVSLHM